MALKRYHLLKGETAWHVKHEGSARPIITGATKENALRMFMEQYGHNATREKAVSLIIHKQDGHIQEERTYPRSADPKNSKG